MGYGSDFSFFSISFCCVWFFSHLQKQNGRMLCLYTLALLLQFRTSKDHGAETMT
jgi:hypothetical protein